MSDASPGISVVMPSYNHRRFIRQAIDSILDQGYGNIEVIVMDGGSTDGTVDILSSYGERIRWVSERDGGQSDALSKGFAKATKSWLTWLNSDDIQDGRALHRVAEAIRMHPQSDVFVGGAYYMDVDGRRTKPYPTISFERPKEVERQLWRFGYLAQPSVYFARRAYDAAGGLDATLHFCMDYDLWVRLARSGARFTSIDGEISGNRWHADAKSAALTLPLLAEVTHTQVKYWGKVSPFFVQAVSDHLYSILHSKHRGDQHHLVVRSLYFKSCWVWFNSRRPLHCLWGLLTENIAKSGPLVDDRLGHARFVAHTLRALMWR